MWKYAFPGDNPGLEFKTFGCYLIPGGLRFDDIPLQTLFVSGIVVSHYNVRNKHKYNTALIYTEIRSRELELDIVNLLHFKMR